MVDLSSIEAWARADLDRRNAARETALRVSRELVRTCANSIRATHRRDYAQAETLLARATELNREMTAAVAGLGDLYWSGYVQDAQKEWVEAHATLALVTGSELPDPLALGVSPAVYLNGLAEAVGELRRYLLDLLRRGEVDAGEPLLDAMDDIYSLLVTLDYPDTLTGGLRRTTDLARSILEKTRGDLTVAIRQEALQRALRGAAGTA